jgi:hypothetical protein
MRVNKRVIALLCIGLALGFLGSQFVIARTQRDRFARRYWSLCFDIAFAARARSGLYKGQPWSREHEDTADTLSRFLSDCADDSKGIEDAMARVKRASEPNFGFVVQDPSAMLQAASDAYDKDPGELLRAGAEAFEKGGAR